MHSWMSTQHKSMQHISSFALHSNRHPQTNVPNEHYITSWPPTETEKVISNTDDNYKIATILLQNMHKLK